MYLKSLVLKGFKSFADRSVLTLEPGITAIVGPNGSGKSNISDAVLWVLGERNVKHLRGQAMEDVIFSGSSARKPVAVAEVELVLDNSDGMLPVEFDEVSIARRLYRTGESEYLINGTVARRMDVLDILHDTGLGTGTHSIISQGSLDSILQSKPEDRRALIEEAAGVLKHKQRKEKSARKLEKMDNHLARVRDVSAEIERQLGPLERKAKRAIAYEAASAELAEVKLALAVDDLRRLQKAWDTVCAGEEALGQDIEAKRAAVAASEKKAADLAEVIRQKSLSAGELAKSQRAATAVSERLESCEMLLREKRRAARGYEADLSVSMQASVAKLDSAQAELESARAQLTEVEGVYAHATAEVERISGERFAAAEKRREAEAQAQKLANDIRLLERKRDDARRRRDALKEGLSASMAHERIAEARMAEIAGEADRVRAEAKAVRAKADEAASAATDLEARYEVVKKQLGEAFAARESAHAALEQARADVAANESESAAIKRAQRAHASGVPALAWLMDNASKWTRDPAPLASALGAPKGLESLVEQMLADDLEALMIEDAASAKTIARELAAAAEPGAVTLVLRNHAHPLSSVPARAAKQGSALLDLLTYPESAAHALETLLGDVVVCDTRDAAFEAASADSAGLTFVSRDGCAIDAKGRVKLFGRAVGEDEGVLARERKLTELAGAHVQLASALEAAQDASNAADAAYQSAQAASLTLSQELAEARGNARSLADDASKAEAKLAQITREAQDIEQQHAQAQRALDEMRPNVDAVSAEIESLDAEYAAAIEQQQKAQDSVAPLRAAAGKLGEELANAKLEAAKLGERKSYAERMLKTRERDIAEAEKTIAASRASIRVKKVAQERIDPLLAVLGAISISLRGRIRVIEDAVLDSESATSDIHESAALARDAAREARDAFDQANSAMADTRIEKGRLELQVDAAVRAIVEDCGVPIDKAKDLPLLENRSAAEDDAFRLERKIKNMGVINPDAAREYEELKKRYDFFSSQLADMEAARKSLNRIVRIIDARMKDDFVNTFELVNKNFGETFSQLFPGGSAELVLEDPDDLENTGIEVKAQPRGKRITKMSLLSGGEKSLTAIALLFAVYRVRSTPFYILDEVEAALDDTNLRRLIAYVNSLRSTTQLLMITHQRRTMETADVLFGVSMQEDGVTKVISQKLERALELAE